MSFRFGGTSSGVHRSGERALSEFPHVSKDTREFWERDARKKTICVKAHLVLCQKPTEIFIVMSYKTPEGPSSTQP